MYSETEVNFLKLKENVEIINVSQCLYFVNYDINASDNVPYHRSGFLGSNQSAMEHV